MNYSKSSTSRVSFFSTLQKSGRAGFTLVEIMVVVVVIGLLASMAIAGFTRVKERTENTTLANDLRIFAAAFDQYALELGSWPADAATGVVPVEMSGRIKEEPWARKLPLGAAFDWDTDLGGIRAGISIGDCTYSDARLNKLDAIIDDGNINTGKFRRIFDGRPCFILQE